MTWTKTLVIGVRPNNLGAAIMQTQQYPGNETYGVDKLHLDVTDQGSIEQWFRERGAFDKIVYCAGHNELRWTHEHTVDTLTHTYQVNAIGLAAVVAEHERQFPEHGGAITAIVSDSYRTPMRGSLAYSSSKAALVGVIRNLARELAPRWQVNGVSPGIIADTPMTDYIDDTVPVFRGWDADAAKSYEKSMIPMGRRVTKEEVSDLVHYTLNSPDFLTGSILEIAGGK